jgi:hypothetical protein
MRFLLPCLTFNFASWVIIGCLLLRVVGFSFSLSARFFEIYFVAAQTV